MRESGVAWEGLKLVISGKANMSDVNVVNRWGKMAIMTDEDCCNL